MIRHLFISILWGYTVLFGSIGCAAPQMASPTPIVPNNREVRAMPSQVTGVFAVNDGIEVTAVVRSASELVVTVRLLKPAALTHLEVRQQVVADEGVQSQFQENPIIHLHASILSNYDEGITLPIRNADMVETIPYTIDSDLSTLVVPPQNTFVYTVPLVPARPNHLHALLLERYEGETRVATTITVFRIAGTNVIR